MKNINVKSPNTEKTEKLQKLFQIRLIISNIKVPQFMFILGSFISNLNLLVINWIFTFFGESFNLLILFPIDSKLYNLGQQV